MTWWKSKSLDHKTILANLPKKPILKKTQKKNHGQSSQKTHLLLKKKQKKKKQPKKKTKKKTKKNHKKQPVQKLNQETLRKFWKILCLKKKMERT